MAIYTSRREEMIVVVRSTLFYLNADEPVPVHSLSALSGNFSLIFELMYKIWFWLILFCAVVCVIIVIMSGTWGVVRRLKTSYCIVLRTSGSLYDSVLPTYLFYFFVRSGSYLGICRPRCFSICFARLIRISLWGRIGFIVPTSSSMCQILASSFGSLVFRFHRQKSSANFIYNDVQCTKTFQS